MNKLDLSDIQGYVIRGYRFPFASFAFLEIEDPGKGQELIGSLIGDVTTGERFDGGKPATTLNIAFSHRGLAALGLPDPTLDSFPVEFQQGMRGRSDVLNDTGVNAPENWEPQLDHGGVHVWLRGHPPAGGARHAKLQEP